MQQPLRPSCRLARHYMLMHTQCKCICVCVWVQMLIHFRICKYTSLYVDIYVHYPCTLYLVHKKTRKITAHTYVHTCTLVQRCSLPHHTHTHTWAAKLPQTRPPFWNLQKSRTVLYIICADTHLHNFLYIHTYIQLQNFVFYCLNTHTHTHNIPKGSQLPLHRHVLCKNFSNETPAGKTHSNKMLQGHKNAKIIELQSSTYF